MLARRRGRDLLEEVFADMPFGTVSVATRDGFPVFRFARRRWHRLSTPFKQETHALNHDCNISCGVKESAFETLHSIPVSSWSRSTRWAAWEQFGICRQM